MTVRIVRTTRRVPVKIPVIVTIKTTTRRK